jgi:hypothetical protein
MVVDITVLGGSEVLSVAQRISGKVGADGQPLVGVLSHAFMPSKWRTNFPPLPARQR